MSIKALASRYFAAAAGSAAISFLTLPLTTNILGPRAFGAVAVVGALVAVGGAFATLGTSFVIYRHLPQASADEANRLIGTLCWVGVAVAAAWGLVATAGFVGLRPWLPALQQVPVVGFALALAAMLLSPFWAVTMDVLTAQQRAGLFARALLIQAFVTASITLACLYWFDLGTVSLFAGNFAGTAVLFAASAAVLRARMRPRIDRTWALKLREMAVANAGAQASETGYTLAERFLLSRFSGLQTLGLYAHSQRYRDVTQLAVKAVGRGALPLGLEEARDPEGDFPSTRATWAAVYVVIAAAGAVAASAGDVLLSVLTHGKFTSAYVFLGPWFVFVLLQNAARPEFATLFALGEGRTVARVNLWTNTAALALLLVLVPWLGAPGAAAAAIAQVGMNRVAIARAARRYRPTPRHDRWVARGIVIITLAVVTKEVLQPAWPGSVLLAAVWGGLTVLIGRSAVTPVVAKIMQPWTRR